MTTTHTPGPWKIAGHGNGAGILEIDATSTKALCGVIRGSLADARLIAAAPDLLAALRLALEFCERLDEEGSPARDNLTRDAIRAALKKAGAA